jgi:parallel beta-helix repeat protein
MRQLKFFLSIMLVAVPCTAGVIYVEGGGTGSGTSWLDAYGNLQDALDAVAGGDEIWVAAGIYYPTELIDPCDPRTATFQMKNGVRIYGGFPDIGDPGMADRDPNLYETVLSGDIGVPGDNSDNCYHVFYHPEGLALDPNAMLDGFTIVAGNADGSGVHRYGGGMYNYESSPTVTNCTFTENSAGYIPGGPGDGSGMYNSWSSPTVTNCTFTGNIANRMGGGMLNRDSSSPTVVNCTFSGNSANGFYGGGGMLNNESSPTVTDCTFTGNSAESGGGMLNSGSSPAVTNCTFTANSGVSMLNSGGSPTITNCTFTANSGGGMWNSDSSPTVTNCTFTGNSADDSGGGMHNWNGSSPTVTNCTFTGNYGRGGGMYNDRSSPTVTNCTFIGNLADYGGGMVNFQNNPTLTNCTFIGNSAEISGGGMANSSHSSPTVTNCTFTANWASSGGGIYNEWESSPTVTNCILWANIAPDGNEIHNFYKSTPVISNCDITGCGASGAGWDGDLGSDGGGNIDTDPYFVDIGYWDPNNTPDNPNDDFWVNGDYHLLSGSPCIDAGDNSAVDPNSTDLDGNPRIMNDVVDMGAYEFLPPMEADVHIIPKVINRNNRLKRIIAIVRLPEGINKSDVSDEPFILSAQDFGDDGIEATWQRVIGRPGRVSVFAFFDKAELMELVSRNGRVEITVTGKLESGRCIYGSDTVRITRPTRRRPLRWRRR